MFGDMGHGTMLFCFAIYLFTLKPNPAKPKLLDDAFPFRFLFLFMGFFAIYCGMIYNDFLSLSLDLYGSCFIPEHDKYTRT